MTIVYSVETEQTPGPRLVIDCPKCGEIEVSADTYEQCERLKLFFFIPILSLRNTFVVCQACNAKLTSGIQLDDFDDYSDEEISDTLNNDTLLVFKVLAVCSVILFMFPIVGLAIPLIVFLATMKTGGWPRMLALIGLGLSGMVHLLFLVALLKDL